MKTNFKGKLSIIILIIVLSLLIIKTIEVLNPKKVARYCIDDKCITVVIQYHRVISGGDSQIRIYKRKVSTRYLLNFGSYAEFPIETHFLISKNLVNQKFLISSQVLPDIKGNLEDEIIFDELKYYSEGDNENIGSFDLDYSNF
ncbi:hypothetical protein FOR85_12295 [Psychrobacter sp. YGAH215]|uniref:hypothetical protein n=1 Tax=Psychrobacter sp. YGAH215 TaxID=2596826 RepID=UPI0011857480|nr:hypothetical protein [Psychrobacter sp. YGAH215]TSB21672.1 hypothetical protein FOR85_12295 [Psychrobacter sp. YGAH215]